MTATPTGRSRRLAALAGLLGAAFLLVAGKAATAPPPGTVQVGTSRMPDPVAPSAGSGGPAASSSAAAAPASPAGPQPKTVLGDPVDIGYGIVQVRLTLTGGRITDVEAVRLPVGGRSARIADYAGPRLRSEVLAAQSAHIDTVSGASYTSEGYAESVQSALDAAPR